jgi:hypothetical protein
MPLVDIFKGKNLREAYLKYVSGGTDISEHLPMLFSLAQQCDYVTEFGVRTGVSTVALLAGLESANRPVTGKLTSYDFAGCTEAKAYITPMTIHNVMRAHDLNVRPIEWEFINADTCNMAPINATDFLFIDSTHTAQAVYAELNRHAMAVRKYLGCHATASCAEVDPGQPGDPKPLGLLWGIHRYMHEHPNDWALIHESMDNNGLRIYRRM